MTGSSTPRTIRKRQGDTVTDADDSLAVEEPLEIRIGDEPLAVTMRTPGHDEELAAGFCVTEGVIDHDDDLERVAPCERAEFGNIITVTLTDEAAATHREQIACARRETYLSSSCGLCGKQSIDRIRQRIPPLAGDFTVAPRVIEQLPERMRQIQSTFERTGGLHAAALFRPSGELKVLREDVGRHNAVDKVVGWALFSGQLPWDPGVLLVSGRASFEIMQKAAVAGIAMVCAVSAPSSLAVDFAAETNMTLVGFLRPGRMNIYHDPGRIHTP